MISRYYATNVKCPNYSLQCIWYYQMIIQHSLNQKSTKATSPFHRIMAKTFLGAVNFLLNTHTIYKSNVFALKVTRWVNSHSSFVSNSELLIDTINSERSSITKHDIFSIMNQQNEEKILIFQHVCHNDNIKLNYKLLLS